MTAEELVEALTLQLFLSYDSISGCVCKDGNSIKIYPPINMYYFTPWKTNVVTINYLLKEVIIFIFTAFFFLERRSFVRESTWDLEADKFVFLS